MWCREGHHVGEVYIFLLGFGGAVLREGNTALVCGGGGSKPRPERPPRSSIFVVVVLWREGRPSIVVIPLSYEFLFVCEKQCCVAPVFEQLPFIIYSPGDHSVFLARPPFHSVVSSPA